MSIESQKKRMGVEVLKTTTERIAKIMIENSPYLVKDINLKAQEAQWKRKGSSVNSQKDKFKEIHPKIYNYQTAENSKQKKILKSRQKDSIFSKEE